MKSRFNVIAMRPYDQGLMSLLLGVKEKCCTRLSLPIHKEVAVPAQVWVEEGGHPNLLPASVTLTYPRKTGDVHLSHHYLDRLGNVKATSLQSYCGSSEVAKVSPYLEEVTCPECLRWVRRENTTH